MQLSTNTKPQQQTQIVVQLSFMLLISSPVYQSSYQPNQSNHTKSTKTKCI